MQMAAATGKVGSSGSVQVVSLVCQRCSQPIRLTKKMDPSALNNLRQVALDQLQQPLESDPASPEGEETAALPRSSTTIHGGKGKRASEMPALKGQEDVGLAEDIVLAAEVFAFLSEHCDVDHPLCSECPEAVLEGYQKQLAQHEDAARLYEELLAQLSAEVSSGEKGGEGAGADQEQLEALRREEEELKLELLRSEEKRMRYSEELVKEREREAGLKREEEEYWRDFNEHQRQMLQFADDQLSVSYQLQYYTEQLERLKKTNIINATFHIWHNGYFGTINGLRLGRLQSVPVEWGEINAAWGQTIFLLNTLARMSGVAFERYRLVPYGNQSFIEVLDGKKKVLPLHYTSGIRLFQEAKFDSAMVAFLDCLQQFKAHVEKSSKGEFALPYKIEKDRIGDDNGYFSIKMNLNSMENWTKALKYTLTDLRWALTWVSASV